MLSVFLMWLNCMLFIILCAICQRDMQTWSQHFRSHLHLYHLYFYLRPASLTLKNLFFCTTICLFYLIYPHLSDLGTAPNTPYFFATPFYVCIRHLLTRYTSPIIYSLTFILIHYTHHIIRTILTLTAEKHWTALSMRCGVWTVLRSWSLLQPWDFLLRLYYTAAWCRGWSDSEVSYWC